MDQRRIVQFASGRQGRRRAPVAHPYEVARFHVVLSAGRSISFPRRYTVAIRRVLVISSNVVQGIRVEHDKVSALTRGHQPKLMESEDFG